MPDTKTHVRFTGEIKEAGLKILNDLEDGPIPSRPSRKITPCDIKLSWRYWVRYLCCGREGKISHGQISRRIKDNLTQCKKCSDAETRRSKKSRKSFSRRKGAPKENTGVINRWATSFLKPPNWTPPVSTKQPGRDESERNC